MNLYSEYFEARHSAMNKFLRGKTLIKLYIFPVKCARKEFYTVFTEKELAQMKIKRTGACDAIGERAGDKEIWQETREKLSDPELKKHDDMIRYINAENKARRLAEKMRKEEKKWQENDLQDQS